MNLLKAIRLKRPNFFIVGAPKCGTTAMNTYLVRHPDIFMAQKELHFFGSDLKHRVKINEDEYLNHFQNATDEKIIGEASVWYLFSKTAAAEIKNFAPNAKILIMLRDPVEMLYSLHSQHLFNANEDVKDFEKALQLDTERTLGKHMPNSLDFLELPLYRESALFAEQVKRYINTFGINNVHIILYEDFKNNTKETVNETLEFLGLLPSSNIIYEIINPNKEIKFLTLHQLIKNPPGRVRKIVRTVLPIQKIRHLLMVVLLKLNIRRKKRKEMNEKINNELREFFYNDIKELSTIIHRDLTRWM